MASYSANDIIEKAAVKARIKGPGETLSAPKATMIYDDLNDLLESWALESLMTYYRTSESFSMQIGVKEYTWDDVGGTDFVSPRPLNLLDETFIREDLLQI